jgi:hypothetical protein
MQDREDRDFIARIRAYDVLAGLGNGGCGQA